MLHEARHSYVRSPEQTFEDRSEYSQIYRDYRIQLHPAGRIPNDTITHFTILDHCRNPVGALRRTTSPLPFPLPHSTALEFHPTLYFTPRLQNLFESSSGGSVLLLYAVRWFPTPLRMEILRLLWHTQGHRLFHSRHFRTFGQKSTSSGSSATSPDISFVSIRIPQTWIRTCPTPSWVTLVALFRWARTRLRLRNHLCSLL